MDTKKCYSLDKVTNEGRKHETATHNMQLNKPGRYSGKIPEETEINFFRKKAKGTKGTVFRYCGKDHPKYKEACPAKDSRCRTCSKIGH